MFNLDLSRYCFSNCLLFLECFSNYLIKVKRRDADIALIWSMFSSRDLYGVSNNNQEIELLFN